MIWFSYASPIIMVAAVWVAYRVGKRSRDQLNQQQKLGDLGQAKAVVQDLEQISQQVNVINEHVIAERRAQTAAEEQELLHRQLWAGRHEHGLVLSARDSRAHDEPREQAAQAPVDETGGSTERPLILEERQDERVGPRSVQPPELRGGELDLEGHG